MPRLGPNQDIRSKVGCHSQVRTKARHDKSYGKHHLGHLHSHQIMDSKVTEVQHQHPHQWPQCLRDWEDQGVHAVANGPAGNLEAIWRSTYQSSMMRTPGMLSHNTTTLKPWMLQTRNFFSYTWVIKKQYWTGGAPVKTPPGSQSIILRMFSSRLCIWAEAWPFLWWTP